MASRSTVLTVQLVLYLNSTQPRSAPSSKRLLPPPTSSLTMPGYLQGRIWIKSVPSAYAPDQVAQYLGAIGFLPKAGAFGGCADIDLKEGKFPRDLATMTEVVKHHLIAFPFENTAMHYTDAREMDIIPQALFQRLVVERKGSFCFGQNTLLLEMLRGLGFRAYAGSARVNMAWQTPDQDPVYTFQSHMLIFIQPFDGSEETYVVDVGFGGSGLVRPVPLVAGKDSLVMGVGDTEFHHLVKEPFPYSSLVSRHSGFQSNSGQDVWHLEVMHIGREGSRSPWKRMYSFTEHEFFAADCEASSGWVTKSMPLFTDNVLAIRYILNEGSRDGDMYRVILFGDEVKARKKNGETKVLATVKTEFDRVKVLREIFGIMIEDKNIEYIKGTPAQMKS